MSKTTQSSIYRRTLIKDASSYILPVMIVLAAILFSMGNIFSVNAADEVTSLPVSSDVATIQKVTMSGSAGIQISDFNSSPSEITGVDIP